MAAACELLYSFASPTWSGAEWEQAVFSEATKLAQERPLLDDAILVADGCVRQAVEILVQSEEHEEEEAGEFWRDGRDLERAWDRAVGKKKGSEDVRSGREGVV